MDIMDLQGIIMGAIPILIIIIIVGVLVVPIIIEDLTISKLDEGCYQTEKAIYCQNIGMELGTIVVTPGGIFGGRPYNTDACVSETSEKIIKLKDTNYERCLPT